MIIVFAVILVEGIVDYVDFIQWDVIFLMDDALGCF